MTGSAEIRVVSIPHRHPYIEAITSRSTVSLVTPEHDDAARPSWAPSPMLSAAWVRENADRFDLVHVHFGFEPFSLVQLEAFVAALAAANKPLVLTAHDLSNPQLRAEQQGEYREKLAVLIRAADRVVTLTNSAAAEIAADFGARAVVVTHPPQLPVDAPEPEPRRKRAGPARVGVLMKDARPAFDVEALPFLARAAVLVDVDVEVIRHEGVRAGREAAVAAALAVIAEESRMHIRTKARMSDDELAEWLMSLDLLALPYAHGTHSGMLELANELGLRVIVPPIGHFADQWAGVNEVASFHDADDLAAALTRALDAPPLERQSRAMRHETLAAVQLEHVQLYQRVLRAREQQTAPRFRVLVIAPFRYPIAQPHQGGLEAYVWSQVRELQARGHEVVLAAPEGSEAHEPGTPEAVIYPGFRWPQDALRDDTSFPPGVHAQETAAFRAVGEWLTEHAAEFDIVHNHAFHPEVFAWAARLSGKLAWVTTLHTPPVEDVLEALKTYGIYGRFLAVSPPTAAAWQEAVPGLAVTTLTNAVDTAEWTFGHGGEGLVWFGRIVPEKAPHLALRAACVLRAAITIAGPASAPRYAEQLFAEAEGCECWATFLGPLRQRELADLVARSAVTLVTPDWEEPFGLVVAESLACGTPVVALRRGGLGDVFAAVPGVALVDPGADDNETVAKLAERVRILLDQQRDPVQGPWARAQARRSAVTRFSLDRHLDALVEIYRAERSRVRP